MYKKEAWSAGFLLHQDDLKLWMEKLSGKKTQLSSRQHKFHGLGEKTKCLSSLILRRASFPASPATHSTRIVLRLLFAPTPTRSSFTTALRAVILPLGLSFTQFLRYVVALVYLHLIPSDSPHYILNILIFVAQNLLSHAILSPNFNSKTWFDLCILCHICVWHPNTSIFGVDFSNLCLYPSYFAM